MVTALPRIIRSAQGRPIFGLLRASVYLRTVAGVFLLYFVPGMKCLHAVPVGWMYLIGVMEVAGRRRYWTLSKRLTILKIYSVTTLGRLCQKGSQYVAIDWELNTIGDFTPQDPFPCVSTVSTNHFQSTPKTHLQSSGTESELICRCGSTDFREARNNCHRQQLEVAAEKCLLVS